MKPKAERSGVVYAQLSTCTKCDGVGKRSGSYAPNPDQPNVLRPRDKMCKPCNGLGVVVASK